MILQYRIKLHLKHFFFFIVFELNEKISVKKEEVSEVEGDENVCINHRQVAQR